VHDIVDPSTSKSRPPLAEARPRLGVCQSMLGGPGMADDLDLVAEAGLHSIGLSGGAVQATGVAETVRLLHERSLTASSYAGGVSVLGTPDELFDDALRARVTIAADLGAPSIVLVTGLAGDRSPTEADDEIATRLARVAPFARERGVRLSLEPLHPFLHTLTYVHTLGHAAEIAARVPGCGVVFDLVHTHWDRRLHDDIATWIDVVDIVHVGNLDRAALAAKQWMRSAPDDGVIPLDDLILAVHAAGYRGAYELEVITPSMTPDECRALVHSAGEWFAGLWND
jgi:sugar phosphate isomerase/epimerase